MTDINVLIKKARLMLAKKLLKEKQQATTPSTARILHGQDAVDAVTQSEGDLTPEQTRVVMEEGFSTATYDDTKGIQTTGVGQTGQYANKTFKETFFDIEKLASRLLKGYGKYPTYLRSAIMSAAYRGDLQQSPKFRKLMNTGKFDEAATEFLNHKEYLNPKTPSGIKTRLEKISDAVRMYAEESDNPRLDDGYYTDSDGHLYKVLDGELTKVN